MDEMEARELKTASEEIEKIMKINALMKMNHWFESFDERQKRLILNCRAYASHDPAGLPGHNLMLIIDKMADMLESHWDDLESNESLCDRGTQTGN